MLSHNRLGMNLRNFQTAKPVNTLTTTSNIPIYRQLATIPNSDQARLIRSLNLRRESHRFQTFTADWPSDSAPSAEDMAASGWFYLGNLDRTQCFCCGGVLRNWRRLDNSHTEHITHFPHCTMAQGVESQNILDMDRQVRNELNKQQNAQNNKRASVFSAASDWPTSIENCSCLHSKSLKLLPEEHFDINMTANERCLNVVQKRVLVFCQTFHAYALTSVIFMALILKSTCYKEYICVNILT